MSPSSPPDLAAASRLPAWVARVRRDTRTLAAMARPVPRQATLRDRLEHFYAPQAADYDDFRDRMLHGRHELIDRLPARPGAVWVELGAGTGRNLDFLGDRLGALERVFLVDLTRPLMAVARSRCAARGWSNVTLIEADAARTGLPGATADVVVCSYALSMMPHWRGVLEEAARLLAPGGLVGVVDFHQPDRPAPVWRHLVSHRFVPWWFRRRHVYLSPAPLIGLLDRFRFVDLVEAYGSIPYLPGIRAPYFRFIGAR